MLGADTLKRKWLSKMVVRSGSERFAAVRIFAFFLGMAGFIAPRGVGQPRRKGRQRSPIYIVDGRVDKRTYNGFRRYHGVCNHCHGPDGVGSSFGPSLIEAPMTIEEFRTAVLMGRATGSRHEGLCRRPQRRPIRRRYLCLPARPNRRRHRPSPPAPSGRALRCRSQRPVNPRRRNTTRRGGCPWLPVNRNVAPAELMLPFTYASVGLTLSG